MSGACWSVGRARRPCTPISTSSPPGTASPPDPGPGPEGSPSHRKRTGQFVKAPGLRGKPGGGQGPEGHAGHRSRGAAPEDRILTDTAWATLARRVLHVTGNAPDGCRWSAVHHADDHLHIAAAEMRRGLRPPRNRDDSYRAMTEVTRVGTDFGLLQVSRDKDTWRTALSPPTARKSRSIRSSTRARW